MAVNRSARHGYNSKYYRVGSAPSLPRQVRRKPRPVEFFKLHPFLKIVFTPIRVPGYFHYWGCEFARCGSSGVGSYVDDEQGALMPIFLFFERAPFFQNKTE
jgi:hypothetical protein